MADSTGRFSGQATSVRVGEKRATYTATTAGDALLSGAGKVAAVSIAGDTTGTGWDIKIYDDPAATNNLIWSWHTGGAALGTHALQMPLSNGLFVVIAGTFPTDGVVSIVYE